MYPEGLFSPVVMTFSCVCTHPFCEVAVSRIVPVDPVGTSKTGDCALEVKTRPLSRRSSQNHCMTGDTKSTERSLSVMKVLPKQSITSLLKSTLRELACK